MKVSAKRDKQQGNHLTGQTDYIMVKIFDITNTIFTSKTYIIYKEGCSKAWLVDIGDVEPVLLFLKEHGLNAEGVFITHAHFDHIYGIKELVKQFPECKVYVQAYAKQALASEKLNMSKYHEAPISFTSRNIVVVKENETLNLIEGEPDIEFYETPGHNPGCLTMVMGNVIFTGDAYIPGVGANTIPPYADKVLAKKSMERILKLAEGKEILSGHKV